MSIQHESMYRDHETDLYPASTLVHINLSNDDKGYIFSEWVEQWPADQAPSYQDLQREYGRCTSKVYVDQDNASPKAIGWYFVSRQQYEDGEGKYLRGAWVTLTQLPALDFLPMTVREALQGVELIALPTTYTCHAAR